MKSTPQPYLYLATGGPTPYDYTNPQTTKWTLSVTDAHQDSGNVCHNTHASASQRCAYTVSAGSFTPCHCRETGITWRTTSTSSFPKSPTKTVTSAFTFLSEIRYPCGYSACYTSVGAHMCTRAQSVGQSAGSLVLGRMHVICSSQAPTCQRILSSARIMTRPSAQKRCCR
jgi:hypothetical protein